MPTSTVAEKTDGGEAEIDGAGLDRKKPKAGTGKKDGGGKAVDKVSHVLPAPFDVAPRTPLSRQKNFRELQEEKKVGTPAPAEKDAVNRSAETPIPAPCSTPVLSSPHTRSAGPVGKVKGVTKAKGRGKGKSVGVEVESLMTNKTVNVSHHFHHYISLTHTPYFS